MVLKRYAKLIRDKVPELIRRQGAVPTVRQLEGVELKDELLNKLVEEAEDLQKAFKRKQLNFEEQLADVLEVIDKIKREWSISDDELQKIKELKKQTHGGFEDGVFLENVQ